jgi:arylsulfatase
VDGSDDVGKKAEAVSTKTKSHDVVIAGYPTIDAAIADFGALTKLVRAGRVNASGGVILVERGHDGEVRVADFADDRGRKGLAWGGGVGLVVGLFAPPLLASVALGAAAGRLIGTFVGHRLERDIADRVGRAVVDMAGVITLVAAEDTGEIATLLASRSVETAGTGHAVNLSVVGVDGGGFKALEEGLLESACLSAQRAR